MLLSEFTERTGFTPTSEEYADIEELYNGVKMNKDEFCKCWMKEHKNPLFKELAEAYCKETRNHQYAVSSLKALKKDFDTFKEQKTKQIENIMKDYDNRFKEFGEKIIRLNLKDETKALYDIIEEELGIKFIIQTKHDNNIPLSDDEISYLVGKL